MKRMSNEEKINKIKTERQDMINVVLDNINNNKNILVEEVEKIAQVINKDEENSKKYIEILKIQELIENLSNEIINANTKEDIISLRKKLNYCINKVKNIMRSRGMSDEDINAYSLKVNNLRKDIAKYLRYVKRINNINLIDELNNNYDNLTNEELIQYKKLIRLENNYNKRILNPTPKKNNKSNQLETNTTKIIFDDVKEDKQLVDDNIIVEVVDSEYHVNESVRDYIKKQVELFMIRYGVKDIHPYRNTIVHNISTFIKNLSIYSENKKSIHNMINEYNYFYGGNDLYSFIAYTRQHNSIKYGLKQIFSKTNLYSKEDDYLKEHEECVDWILDYCKKKKLSLQPW